MIDCKCLNDFLIHYIEGDLPPDQVASFEDHLGMCPPCQQFVDTYRQTIDMERDALVVEDCDCEQMPEQLVAAIVNAMKSQTPE